jgi:hypothetical protein
MMQKLRRRKRRIARRLADRRGPERERPMLDADTIHYELTDRARGIAAGGIGAMLLLARRTGLVADIDRRLHLLKRHLPYHESDHVLNIAFNILAGGRRLEHLELRRNDEVYLDALGARRIPDPTTAGDFCRRFGVGDVLDLMDAINDTRARVWEQQPAAFFDEADQWPRGRAPGLLRRVPGPMETLRPATVTIGHGGFVGGRPRLRW